MYFLLCCDGVRKAVDRALRLGLASTLILSATLALDVSTAKADVAPVAARSASVVTADALPTVQIDGVVWAQAVVGNTVYAGGSFANARPAGAASGESLTPRGNLLAYDITTGALIPSFAPSLNAEVKTVTASPDGTRVYVGGSFTMADGQQRYRIAAYSTATGALVSTFAPSVDATINSITATNTVVYAGGVFGTANGVARSRLAAFSAKTGALLAWAPSTDDVVNAMVLTPDHTKVVIGGAFQTVNGAAVYGLGAVAASTGQSLPWAMNSVVQDWGSASAILSLRTNGKAIYGTGYVVHKPGNFEGTFSADPRTGAINWLAACNGDSYDAFSVRGTVYSVGHSHSCEASGGFPNTTPTLTYHRTTAFTDKPTGTVQPGTNGRTPDLTGQPSSSLVDWFPTLDTGTYTGQSQGAWTVAGNSQYVVEGGEFQHVNGVAQQGLVRFALSSLAPNAQGPQVRDSSTTPVATVVSDNVVRLDWQTNWDPDDATLTYSLYRDDVGGTAPVYTTRAVSQFWNRPQLTVNDTGLVAGKTYTYWVRASDPSGNSVRSANVIVTTTAGNPQSKYAQGALQPAVTHYWRLDQRGTRTADLAAGNDNLIVGSGVRPGLAGAIVDDTDPSSQFTGTASSTAVAVRPESGPESFSVAGWIKTTSVHGGTLIGFNSEQDGVSGTADRSLYMDTAGHLRFGVRAPAATTVASPRAYNDGAWHQVVGTASSGRRLTLYADGRAVAVTDTTAVASDDTGYWRVGNGSLSAWPARPAVQNIVADLDDVAVYPIALSADQVHAQYVLSGHSAAVASAR